MFCLWVFADCLVGASGQSCLNFCTPDSGTGVMIGIDLVVSLNRGPNIEPKLL